MNTEKMEKILHMFKKYEKHLLRTNNNSTPSFCSLVFVCGVSLSQQELSINKIKSEKSLKSVFSLSKFGET